MSFLQVELLIHARSRGVFWGLCSNNRSSEESDGTVARSDLCYVTCGPRNICSPSSLDMCGMNRSFPGEPEPFVCFNSLHLAASSSCHPFLTLANLLIFLYLVNLHNLCLFLFCLILIFFFPLLHSTRLPPPVITVCL